uniref:FAT domain-containing protein n=1 Tax=Schistocephalus solidus TaxID=70667 RepID=A0A183T5U9_SCHSO
LRLIHPSVADLAWDAKPPSEEAVKVNSGAFEAHYSASGTLVQANQLRLQAFATLIHFMPHYYECLRPSMPLILKTIRLCLRPELKENKPLQYNLLRLCDGLLSRLKCQATGRSAEKEPTAGQTAKIEDCSDAADTNTRELLVWWAETVGLILENLTTRLQTPRANRAGLPCAHRSVRQQMTTEYQLGSEWDCHCMQPGIWCDRSLAVPNAHAHVVDASKVWARARVNCQHRVPVFGKTAGDEFITVAVPLTTFLASSPLPMPPSTSNFKETLGL